MHPDSAPRITGVPIALAGIGLNLWCLWYLLLKWPGAWGQPLPLIGCVFCGMSALLLVSFLSTILNAMFRSSPRKIGGKSYTPVRPSPLQGEYGEISRDSFETTWK